MAAIPRLKAYRGPALLSYGFRPFFFFGGCYAALAIAIWLPVFEGEIALATSFAPRDWHVHEMLFGYVAAVLTGFLLTAIPNWTGRLPLQGTPLLVLLIVWFAGRFAIAWSARLGWATVALVDCAFLALVALAASREIIAGQNWHNLKVLGPVCVLLLANIGFHTEAHIFGVADVSTRAAIAAIVILIMLIGGRIVPSFTATGCPARIRAVCRLLRALRHDLDRSQRFGALPLVAMPEGFLTGVALCLAGVFQCVRLARWAGERAGREPLVLILHIAYAFVPLGFVLSGLAAIGTIPHSAGLHAWMVGAAGTMTLAVMTRATLGHTGRELVAGAGTQAIYVAVLAAACARIIGALIPAGTLALHVAALAWLAAFGGFVVLYGPFLFRRAGADDDPNCASWLKTVRVLAAIDACLRTFRR